MKTANSVFEAQNIILSTKLPKPTDTENKSNYFSVQIQNMKGICPKITELQAFKQYQVTQIGISWTTFLFFNDIGEPNSERIHDTVDQKYRIAFYSK